MKNLRKSIKKIALVLLSSFIFVNCSQQDDNINTTNKGNNSIVQRSEKKYSGEELFKSIFFGQGEFAKNISLYNDVEKQFKEGKLNDSDFQLRFNNFVNKLNKYNPNFFKNFQENIYSGNPLIVQNALKTGSIEIYNNLNIISPELTKAISHLESDPKLKKILDKNKNTLTPEELVYQNTQIQNYLEEISPCGPTVCVFYFAFAIHNTIGATANIGIYLAIKFWGPKLSSANMSSNEDNLKNEILISDIVLAVK